jgi:hypothetical protein
MVDVKVLQGERAFLHDLASPVSALHLNLSGILEECEEKGLLPADLREVLMDALRNTERVISLVRSRRDELIAAGVPSERGKS